MQTPRSKTKTLADALEVLGGQTENIVATLALNEAADRLREQAELLARADAALDRCGVSEGAPIRVNIAACLDFNMPR